MLNSPSSAFMVINITFPDVDSGIVPKTLSGYPNYTLSMPVNFVGTGKIYSKKKWTDCTASNCIAEYRITDEFGALKTYSVLDYSSADSGFRGSYSSAGLACNSYFNLTVTMGTRDGSALNTSSEKFFINCEPRLTVTPLEARSAVGDKNRPIFTVTMWNPKDTGMNYDFSISTVSSDQSFALGFLKPTTDKLYVDPSSSGVINVYLSDIGAGRSGSFKMKFKATDSFGKEYSSVNYMLIFAEGLNEFAAWQLIVLAAAGALIFCKIGNTGMKQKTKRRTVSV
ncbi:hypothetical protein HYZ41_03130 [archaeon]|nr:hypothetical protein [archaeon]